MFRVIKKYHKPIIETEKTLHYIDRVSRLTSYQGLLSNKMLDCFIVDTDHKNGLEIHCINEHGLIYIYNKNSMRLITILHPRPSQIKRYYRLLKLTITKETRDIINKCYKRNTDHLLNEA